MEEHVRKLWKIVQRRGTKKQLDFIAPLLSQQRKCRLTISGSRETSRSKYGENVQSLTMQMKRSVVSSTIRGQIFMARRCWFGMFLGQRERHLTRESSLL